MPDHAAEQHRKSPRLCIFASIYQLYEYNVQFIDKYTAR